MPTCHLTIRASKPKPDGYPNEPKTLGEHLKKRRLDLGLIQRDVAKRVEVDKTSVWNWETDRNVPELRFMPAILAFLGYDPRPGEHTLGKRLVRFRQSKGWSQKRCAVELGVDPTTLARWERGEREPRGIHREKINVMLRA